MSSICATGPAAWTGWLRITRFDKMIDDVLPGWTRYPLVQELHVLRGVRQLHAAVLVAEVGPFERFDSPRSLL